MKFATEWAMNRFLLITFLTVVSASAFAQDDRNYRVLSKEFNTDKERQMMRAFLRHRVHAALDRRLQELEAALESPEQLASFQKKWGAQSECKQAVEVRAGRAALVLLG